MSQDTPHHSPSVRLVVRYSSLSDPIGDGEGALLLGSLSELKNRAKEAFRVLVTQDLVGVVSVAVFCPDALARQFPADLRDRINPDGSTPSGRSAFVASGLVDFLFSRYGLFSLISGVFDRRELLTGLDVTFPPCAEIRFEIRRFESAEAIPLPCSVLTNQLAPYLDCVSVLPAKLFSRGKEYPEDILKRLYSELENGSFPSFPPMRSADLLSHRFPFLERERFMTSLLDHCSRFRFDEDVFEELPRFPFYVVVGGSGIGKTTALKKGLPIVCQRLDRLSESVTHTAVHVTVHPGMDGRLGMDFTRFMFAYGLAKTIIASLPASDLSMHALFEFVHQEPSAFSTTSLLQDLVRCAAFGIDEKENHEEDCILVFFHDG